MSRTKNKLEVGDLVQLKSSHKIKKFYKIWDKIGIITLIYECQKGENMGKKMAKVIFFALSSNKVEIGIILDRLMRARENKNEKDKNGRTQRNSKGTNKRKARDNVSY